jgi:hypothetical protein
MSDEIAVLDMKPWHKFKADLDERTIRAWLTTIAQESRKAFMSGTSRHSPPASRDGAWPKQATGALRGSIKAEVRGMGVIVSTSRPYSMYLRAGTSQMGRRKMSDTALEIGMQKAENRMKHWVQWERK